MKHQRVRLIEGREDYPYQEIRGDRIIGFVQYGVEFGHDRISLEGQDTSQFPVVEQVKPQSQSEGQIVGKSDAPSLIPPNDDLVTIVFPDGRTGLMSKTLLMAPVPAAPASEFAALAPAAPAPAAPAPAAPAPAAPPRAVHEDDPDVGLVDPATQTDTPIPGETPIPVRDLNPEAGPIDCDGPFVETAKAVQKRLEVLQPDGSYKAEYPTSLNRLKQIVEMAGLEA